MSAGLNYCGENIIIDIYNSRIKVLNYQGKDTVSFVQKIKKTAKEKQIGKIIFQVNEKLVEPLKKEGFVLEGIIPAFFNGDDCFYLSYFLTAERRASKYLEKEDAIIKEVLNSDRKQKMKPLPKNLKIRAANLGDVAALVQLYRQIFSTYPSMLLNEDYVRTVINNRVRFIAVFDGEKIVSAASAEIDMENNNAEITDCATLPEYSGLGLLTAIITALEKEMWESGRGVLYSLARAGSYGMNAVLHKLNYSFNGRAINNCHICGRFEDMNIWVKTNKKL